MQALGKKQKEIVGDYLKAKMEENINQAILNEKEHRRSNNIPPMTEASAKKYRQRYLSSQCKAARITIAAWYSCEKGTCTNAHSFRAAAAIFGYTLKPGSEPEKASAELKRLIEDAREHARQTPPEPEEKSGKGEEGRGEKWSERVVRSTDFDREGSATAGPREEGAGEVKTEGSGDMNETANSDNHSSGRKFIRLWNDPRLLGKGYVFSDDISR